MKIYTASDYAGMDLSHYKFYYGYEKTVCLDHRDEDCENCEWAFTAIDGDREVMRIGWSNLKSGADQFDVTTNLIAGLGAFIRYMVP